MADSPFPETACAFHTRLRKARRSARLTQGQLALAVGISRNAVTHWERPDGARPTMSHLARVAEVTGSSFDWLCTGRGRMPFQVEPGQDSGMLLRYCAQDETEERILLGLRRLSYPQCLAIAALVASLAPDPDAGAAARLPAMPGKTADG